MSNRITIAATARHNLSRPFQSNSFIFTPSSFVGRDAVYRARATGLVRGVL